jgi:hypothetical protein
MTLPQPSPVMPQESPCCAQPTGVQGGVRHAPAWQTWVGGHPPQSMTLPQPSPIAPHVTSGGQVEGRQVAVGALHWSCTPLPPHVSGDVHAPQSIVPPQPSPWVPQEAPSEAHVALTQAGAPHRKGTPPPPHVWFSGQLPQRIVFPQRSEATPQS